MSVYNSDLNALVGSDCEQDGGGLLATFIKVGLRPNKRRLKSVSREGPLLVPAG